ncbi:hypothetical protein D3C78_937230 [compost metagenome]
MCSTDFAPVSFASSSACGAQNSVGTTRMTSSGCQRSWASTASDEDSEKLARCSMRFRALGLAGTYSGQRITDTLSSSLRLKRQLAKPSRTFQSG